MNKFLYRARKRVNSLNKYSSSELKSVSRLLTWTFKELLRVIALNIFQKIYKFISYIKKTKQSSSTNCKIGIIISGGIGDILLAGILIKELYKQTECKCSIDIFADNKNKLPIINFLFNGSNFISKILRKYKLNLLESTYTVLYQITRNMDVIYYDPKKTAQYSPKLFEFCKKLQQFSTRYFLNSENFRDYHFFILHFAELNEKTRIEQLDLYNTFNTNKSTKLFLNLPAQIYNTNAIFHTLKLDQIKYITLQRGAELIEHTHSSTKLWPQKHYEEFIEEFHKKFPNIKIIQVGCICETYQALKGIDIDLSGKTSLEEVAVILKHSLFHLDG